MTVPAWSGGFIPFARVVHAKYLVADETRAWIGTSNWGPGYFDRSRNVGIVTARPGVSRDVAAFFEMGWSSPYAEPLDVGRDYPEPKVKE